MSEEVLVHHGIKGQRWGVRRFQNEDGTLTEAGRKRKAKDYERQLTELESKRASSFAKAASYNKATNDHLKKLSKVDQGSEAAKELLSKTEFAAKRLSELKDDYSEASKQMDDLLDKIDKDPDLVWGTRSGEYNNRYDKNKDNSDSGYYQSSKGTRFMVRSSSKKKNHRIANNKNLTDHTPVRTEYYYY